jgi:hypothetical protein
LQEFDLMPVKHNPAKRDHLALWLASGGTVSAFSRAQNVPVRTCYLWMKRPGFQEKIAELRASIIDRCVGRLAGLGKKAVKTIGELSTGAESEAVRLAASRAVLSDLISVGTYAVSMSQFNDLQARVEELSQALEVKASSDANGRSK